MRTPATSGALAGLRKLYEPERWALFTEVRSSTGVPDMLRTADAIAVDLLAGAPLSSSKGRPRRRHVAHARLRGEDVAS
jgi:hypothetical protein